MPLFLNQSPARLHFKNVLGQANHFIITNLVGLDAIERGIVTEAPTDLHAVWSPKSAPSSARRSRRMLLDMALVRAVDGLDIYIRHCRRKPYLIQDTEIQRKLDGTGLSIYQKFKVIEDAYQGIDRVLVALLEVMITWRNKSAHYEADTEINTDQWDVLLDKKDTIKTEFTGLDVERLQQDFNEDNPPTFREVASLINATHKFIKKLEGELFSLLNTETYLRQIIWKDINKERSAINEEKSRYFSQKQQHLRRLQSIWGRDELDKREYLQRYLINLGLSPTQKASIAPAVFDDDLILKLSSMKPTQVYDAIRPQVE